MSLPKPYYDDGNGIVIYHGDCREILPHLEPVDLVLTDPPYESEAHTPQRRVQHEKQAGTHGGRAACRELYKKKKEAP